MTRTTTKTTEPRSAKHSAQVAAVEEIRAQFLAGIPVAYFVERLGLAKEGLVRAGCACYTTADEVDRLIAGMREIH